MLLGETGDGKRWMHAVQPGSTAEAKPRKERKQKRERREGGFELRPPAQSDTHLLVVTSSVELRDESLFSTRVSQDTRKGNKITRQESMELHGIARLSVRGCTEIINH